VDLDPEYVEDGVAPEPVQKKQGEEDGEQSEKEDGNEQQEEKATEKQEQKQEEVHVEASKEEKRVISWNDADAFPKTFIFDPVQSREAVVTITVAGKNKNEDEEENEEPIKEIEFPISKLFTESLDQWFVVVEAEKEEGETEKVVTTTHTTTITEVVTETEDDEAVTEVEEEVIEEFLAKNEHEQAEEASATTATKPQALRIHIKAALDLSPIEKLNLTVIELTKQKQQAEAILSVLEREVTALRSRYERLTASQRAAANVSTVRNQGQSGAFLGKRSMAQRRAPKSSFERLKDSISSTFSRRKDNFISAGIFVGSVLLFHNKGENLLD
jgi:hypothetical protein